MPLHQKAFYAISFFLGGVAIMSIFSQAGRSLAISLLLSGLITIGLFIFKKQTVALLSLALVVGVLYSAWYDSAYKRSFTAPLNEAVTFTGTVERVTQSDESQRVDIRLANDYTGKIRVYAREYPTVLYGDSIEITGTLKEISGESAGYYSKEGIGAVMSFPKEIKILSHGQGSRIKTFLYGVRDRVQESFEKSLSPNQATLMTGLVLGKSGGFSKEFTEKLKATGTTHIVALSGQNISIIISGITILLAHFLSRQKTVWLTVIGASLFVLMTGAEASVVRAAIMATIVVIAERSSRVYVMKNSLVATAALMVLVNPKVLVFDVGFQLSFLALIGIVYVKPMLERLFRVTDGGFLKWRENLFTTLSAQLTVLPILLFNFDFFPPLAIITNVLILSFIPITMFWGFLIFFVSLLSPFLSVIVALPARILLGYELGIIDIFSRFSFGISTQGFSIILIIAYYALLVGFMFYMTRRLKHDSKLI